MSDEPKEVREMHRQLAEVRRATRKAAESARGLKVIRRTPQPTSKPTPIEEALVAAANGALRPA